MAFSDDLSVKAQLSTDNRHGTLMFGSLWKGCIADQVFLKVVNLKKNKIIADHAHNE